MNKREDRLGAVLAIGGSLAAMALLARVVGRGASEPPPIPNLPEVGVAGWKADAPLYEEWVIK